MSFFIDVQGFQLNPNSFLCKEIVIFNSVTGCFSHRFIRLPIAFSDLNGTMRTQADVSMKKIHGIKWDKNIDTLEYEQISEFIKNCVGTEDTILVKGSEKKKWLNKIISNSVVDFEECPSFIKLKEFMKPNHCKGHLYDNNLSCAIENVFFMWYWYKYCKHSIEN